MKNTRSWLIFTLFWLILLPACKPALPYPPPETTQPPIATQTLKRPSTASPAPAHTQTPFPTATPGSLLNLEPEDLHGAIVRYWHNWHGAAAEVMQALVDEFNTSNEWKIIVSPVYVDGLDAMDERVQGLLSGVGGQGAGQAGASPPEIVMGYLYQMLGWDRIRSLVNLDEYVNDVQWGLTLDEQADFYPVFWEHDLSAGRRLGIPAQRSAQLLFYNRGWARSLGYLAPPTTVQDFQQQSCVTSAINRNDSDPENDGTGGWMISTDYHALYSWLSVYNSQVISGSISSRQSPYNFAAAESRAAFKFLRELYDQGCAWMPENEYPEVEFTDRQGLFAVGSLLDIPYQAQAFTGAEYQDDWTVIAFPSPRGKPLITVYGPSYALLPSSPQRQLAAWLFIKWLAEPQQQARLVQAGGAFPLRQSMSADLAAYRKAHPQWAAAADLLPLAQAEPALHSWIVVRWALSDAGTQLFRSYFTVDQVPSLANYLNQTVAELHQGFLLPTPTRAPSLAQPTTLPPSRTPLPFATPVPSLTPIYSPTP